MLEEQEASSRFKMHTAGLVLVWLGSHWCELKVETTLTTLAVRHSQHHHGLLHHHLAIAFGSACG